METATVIETAALARSGRKKAGSCRLGLSSLGDAQDAFFLRRLSTNLISSIVASQSLVVAGWKPFFWPSDSRSKAALSFVGDSVNALAMAAFRSSGRSELYAYMDGPMIGADLWMIRKSSFFIAVPSG